MKDAVDYGQVAYEAYYKQAGGKSFISNADLPTWGALLPQIQQAWTVAASAAIGAALAAIEKQCETNPAVPETKRVIRETPEGFKVLGQGDEWEELEYRGVKFKYIGVGASGYYRGNDYLGYTGVEAKAKLDARAVPSDA